MDNVGKCPRHGNTEEWETQEDVVYDGNHYDVGDPHAPAVEVCCVGVGIGGRHPHIHFDGNFCFTPDDRQHLQGRNLVK